MKFILITLFFIALLISGCTTYPDYTIETQGEISNSEAWVKSELEKYDKRGFSFTPILDREYSLLDSNELFYLVNRLNNEVFGKEYQLNKNDCDKNAFKVKSFIQFDCKIHGDKSVLVGIAYVGKNHVVNILGTDKGIYIYDVFAKKRLTHLSEYVESIRLITI